MALPIRDKYYLRSLHEEIGLLDRKLAYLWKYEKFDSEKARTSAGSTLSTKRDQLVRTARAMVESGIEYRAADLPRSLRILEEPDPAAASIVAVD